MFVVSLCTSRQLPSSNGVIRARVTRIGVEGSGIGAGFRV